MSKEHAYAYEAGYRDGSIHYELEHCPACKNIADLQEALEENAKLREELAEWRRVAKSKQDSIDHMRDANAENAKLREDMEDLEGYDQMLRDRLRQVTELKVKSDSENAKLRELCGFMLRCMLRYHDHCDYCLVNGEHCDITYIESDAQELGVEVDS